MAGSPGILGETSKMTNSISGVIMCIDKRALQSEGTNHTGRFLAFHGFDKFMRRIPEHRVQRFRIVIP